MGVNTSKLNIESKIWKKSYFHENYTNNFDRNLALVSYQNNEYLSLGKINIDIFKQQFGDEFVLLNTDGFYDAYRYKYSDKPNCCLIEDTFFIDNNYQTNSCNPNVHTFNSNICDKVLFETCLSKDHFKCKAWIRSVVEQKKHIYFDEVLNFIKKEENRNLDITEVFINALYDFSTNENNYNNIINSIINSYSLQIKEKDYKCAFPSEEIIKLEKSLQTPKECWYKECVLSPTHKLLSSNYYKRSQCSITICDINIKELKISNNKIDIICINNKKNNVNIINNPIKYDKENIIHIPTYLNTIFPMMFVLSLLFLKVK